MYDCMCMMLCSIKTKTCHLWFIGRISLAHFSTFYFLGRPTIDKNLLELEYKIAEGKTLIMPCPATGTPRPEIQFHKDGKKLGITPGFIVSQTEQTLRILSIRKVDSGVYRCVAKNTAGRVAVDYKVTVLSESLSSARCGVWTRGNVIKWPLQRPPEKLV